eukprot:1196205-Prorocentrum_minimum.AAC.1
MCHTVGSRVLHVCHTVAPGRASAPLYRADAFATPPPGAPRAAAAQQHVNKGAFGLISCAATRDSGNDGRESGGTPLDPL